MQTIGQIPFHNTTQPIQPPVNNASENTPSKPQPQPQQPTSKNYQEAEGEKLDNLVNKTNTVLFKMNTIFPFDLFPDEISVDINQVNIITREFLSERRHSIKIIDVTDILVDADLFFASLTIIDQGFKENEIKISFLKKQEAQKFRRITQGLVVAHKQGINLSLIPNSEVLEKVEQLGQIK